MKRTGLYYIYAPSLPIVDGHECVEFLQKLNSLVSNKRKGVTVKVVKRKENGTVKRLEEEARDFIVWTRWENWDLIDESGYVKDVDNSADPEVTLRARWDTKAEYDHEELLSMNGLDFIHLEHMKGTYKDYAGKAHYHDGSSVEIEIIQNK